MTMTKPEPLNKRIAIRLTEAEHAALQEYASSQGRPDLSEWGRAELLGELPNPPRRQTDFSLCWCNHTKEDHVAGGLGGARCKLCPGGDVTPNFRHAYKPRREPKT